MAGEWNIATRSTHCAQCNSLFSPGDQGYTCLEPLPNGGGYLRKDVCKKCYRTIDTKVLYSVWAFKVPAHKPTAIRQEPVQKETAEHLLRSLIQRNDTADIGTIYLLAILMERKKIFIERSVTIDENGTRWRLYEQKKTGDLFKIQDPCINDADIILLQQRLMALLDAPEHPLPSRPTLHPLRKHLHKNHLQRVNLGPHPIRYHRKY